MKVLESDVRSPAGRTLEDTGQGFDRRLFLKFLGLGAGASTLAGFGSACTYFRAAAPDDNPLARAVSRDWEKIYRDQYRYDRAFDWVCSPNDTHACRIRAYVRNGIVVRSGATYDYQDYADLYGTRPRTTGTRGSARRATRSTV